MLNTLFRRRPLVEELEPRILFSADLAPFAPDNVAPDGLAPASEQRVVDQNHEYAGIASTPRNELVIVDAGVEGYQTLLADMLAQAGDTRLLNVVVLDAHRDGIAQISDVLTRYGNLDAVHLVSHGGPGALQLGSGALDASSLDRRAAEVAAWGKAFSADGDWLIYGCDVAAGNAGEAFVQRLSQLTLADVAASRDLTGNAALGGDWDLEFTTGQIDTRLAVSAAMQSQWQGLLETLASLTTADRNTDASVATNPATGAFVVSWTTDGNQDGNKEGVFARVYDAAGNPLGGQISVNTTTLDVQRDSAVAMNANGSFVVVWESKTIDYGIFGQRFDATGAKTGGEFIVNQTVIGDQTAPAIAMSADGSFVVAWQDDRNGGDIYVRHFNAAGVATSDEILANTNMSSGQFAPAVAIKDSGSYVVAWQSDTGGSSKAIFAQRFNAADNPLGAEFRVNTYDTNDQTAPAIAMAPDGSFVIAWSSNSQDGSNRGVYAQRFDPSGAAAGAEFRVNTTTSGHQDRPTVAMDGSGNFVIAWTSDGQDDGGSFGVYAQRYLANGTPDGGEFLVNATAPAHQQNPSAAMSLAGSLVVAWDGNGAGDDKGIFWNRYDASNTSPTATADIAATDEDSAISGSAPGVLGNDSDPDVGAILSVTGVLAGTAGTPTAVSAGGVTIAGAYGSLMIRQDGGYTYTPNATTAQALTAGQSVTDVFGYSIRDDKNAAAAATLTVTVMGLNDAPVAGSDSYTVLKTDTLSIPPAGVLDNDSDVDSVAGSLAVTALNGSPANIGAPLAGAYGSLTLNADGSLTYVPDTGNAAVGALGPGAGVIDSFSYEVSDGVGGSTPGTLVITVAGSNTAPVANDDAYSSPEDAVLQLAAAGVLGNDSDDLNALSATLVSGVANGTLVFNSNGAFTYTPNANFNGSDSFTYRVSDGSLISGNATVTLTVTASNDEPVAYADVAALNQDATLNVGAAAGVLANDMDVDAGDALAVILLETGSASSPVQAGTPGVLTSSYGTLTLYADGSYRYVADGIASRALAAGETSDDSFIYTLQDAAGATRSSTLTFTLTGVNDAPTSAPVTLTAMAEDSGARRITQADLLANAGDVDTATLTATSLAIAAGTGTLVDNLDGSWTYTPALHDDTSVRFSFDISDGSASVAGSASLDLVPVNDAPVIATQAVQRAEAGSAASLVVDASDIEGEPLNFTLSGGADAALFTLDAATGLLQLNVVPDYDRPGDANRDNIYEVSVSVGDGSGGTASLTIQLVVTPGPGVVAAPSAPSAPAAAAESSAPEPEQASGTPAPPPVTVAPASFPVPPAAPATGAEPAPVLSFQAPATPASPPLAPVSAPINRAAAPAISLLLALNQALGTLAGDARALTLLQTSLGSSGFQQQLDQLQDSIRQQLSLDRHTIASTLAVSTGLSVGYVLWLVRGGVLLSSLLTAMPAWRLIDPLPILGHLSVRRHGPDDDDSLEGMLKKSNAQPAAPQDTHGMTP